ncbi:MAG: ribonuclease III domain-containing protein [Candidatus Thorarchaeota archaeon]
MDHGRELSWEPIGLESTLNELVNIVRKIEETTPSHSKRMLRKTRKWNQQLSEVLDSLDKIRTELKPRLEDALGLSIREMELLQVAMFQPSTKNLFSELQIQLSMDKRSPLDKEDYDILVSLSEIAQSLALVGDAAISMAVLHHIWQPKATDVGTLTQRRADIVSNEHLAKVCDSWGLYEQRIHFDPASSSKSEMDHDKGTLVEAICGIIYIENGFNKVRGLIPLLVG